MQLLFEKIPDARVAWCAAKLGHPEFDPPKDRFLNLTGCALDEMIAVVRQPSVFVGNDSGPMHLSAATGNRVLAIFGPTSPKRFGPFPLESPRHLAVTAPQGDLSQLAPEAVFAGVEELRNRAL
jgi:ADP-heptose:LPS heptosyltransferase